MPAKIISWGPKKLLAVLDDPANVASNITVDRLLAKELLAITADKERRAQNGSVGRGWVEGKEEQPAAVDDRDRGIGCAEVQPDMQCGAPLVRIEWSIAKNGDENIGLWTVLFLCPLGYNVVVKRPDLHKARGRCFPRVFLRPACSIDATLVRGESGDLVRTHTFW